MKEMCLRIPEGACPKCGHKQFLVFESGMNVYVTNRDGVAIDSKEVSYQANGKCMNCDEVFDMMPTPIGFIPMTPLRRWFYEYTPHYAPEEEVEFIENPMEG